MLWGEMERGRGTTEGGKDRRRLGRTGIPEKRRGCDSKEKET